MVRENRNRYQKQAWIRHMERPISWLMRNRNKQKLLMRRLHDPMDALRRRWGYRREWEVALKFQPWVLRARVGNKIGGVRNKVLLAKATRRGAFKSLGKVASKPIR